MLNESDALVHQLIARIPELEWKLKAANSFISSQRLPRGLFRFSEPSSKACIAEIKADLHALSQQSNERSAIYLAERMRQKINVLVALCHAYQRENKSEEKVTFGVTMLSTRQQWIRELEGEMNALTQQQQALANTLMHIGNTHDSNVVLKVKSELGEVERRLTLAKEALSRAVS